ncbi:hypothetical protein [Conexibacter sp. CPCC 206217]|uniref:hypothetical protein n=1 Tax=Conexibacter sp. CPCC 206217 TaxID=3064574 RepID=UPI002715B031|nr:hypothetical protein [Conexibacter sp. CPCC 206217]MDO8213907.1 hypothetical protein [Conexibacter sp. CPCC 206217]
MSRRAPSAFERRGMRLALLVALASLLVIVASVVAIMLAIGGSDLDCLGADSGSSAGGAAPSRTARRDIPPDRLRLYQAAGRRYRIDWAFLASIGAQECDHGMCRGDNGYGCAGPMQIAMRRGSPCSPSTSELTEWERWGVDADGDGDKDVNDPADAIFGAARVLRFSKDAPATGGSYAEYREAACRYYGACADGVANYADQVMARAVAYGFHGDGSPAGARPDRSDVQPELVSGGCSQGGETPPVGGVDLGPVVRARAPRRLAPLPASVIAPGFGPSISCDARIVGNVVALMRRYKQRVTACQESGHAASGEHPIGAGLDIVPADGDWTNTMRLARAAGWKESCAASGVAPACARAPFRGVFYNGYPSHGDPAHCSYPCPPHLHLSWNTSASPGGPENAPRTSYFPPSWIDVFGPERDNG